MAVKCENCPLRKRDAFVPLSPAEVRFMQKFKVGELVVDAGTQILMEGSNTPQMYTALHGMGLRYKILPDKKRQVVNFVLPGDFIGLQAGLMSAMGHSVSATTHMTLCVFDRHEMWTLFKQQPERAFDLTWIAASDERFLGEALATVGQRSALQAVAWALLTFLKRGDSLGLVRNGVMSLPYKQQDLADALGLSLVHTNKTLAKLRERQLVNWTDGALHSDDWDALAKVANMSSDPARRRPLI
jgi:CRP/FNR family transcriptional regulator